MNTSKPTTDDLIEVWDEEKGQWTWQFRQFSGQEMIEPPEKQIEFPVESESEIEFPVKKKRGAFFRSDFYTDILGVLAMLAFLSLLATTISVVIEAGAWLTMYCAWVAVPTTALWGLASAVRLAVGRNK